jgi:hypothetical protein
VMAKLADSLYWRRLAADLLAGELDPGGWVDAGEGRRWRQPNISSLSRVRGKLGSDPLRMLFEHVAGPVGAEGAPGRVVLRAARHLRAHPGGPELPVARPGPRRSRDGRAHTVARLRQLRPQAGEGAARRHVPRAAEPGPQGRGPPVTVRVIEYTVPEGGGEESSEVFCLVTDLHDPDEYPAPAVHVPEGQHQGL